MAKELIVSVNGREKKIAIIENEKVTEFYIERGEGNQGIVGNIYKGRVMRVLPGMQSAFVDVGLERDAFLYVSDFFDEEEEFERIVIDKTKKGDVEAAQRAAAEQIALGRVERERHIEATHEKVEPLRDMEHEVETAEAVESEREEQTDEAAAEAGAETGDTTKRRSRRGRRRRGVRETSEGESAPQPRKGSPPKISIHRLLPPILRSSELSMKRMPTTAKCLRTRVYRSDCSIRFTRVSSTWKTIFAPPRWVPYCRMSIIATIHFSGSTMAIPAKLP